MNYVTKYGTTAVPIGMKHYIVIDKVAADVVMTSQSLYISSYNTEVSEVVLMSNLQIFLLIDAYLDNQIHND